MRAHLGRRQFNLLLGSGVAAGTVPGLLRKARAQDDRTITVLNWQGYGTDEAWAVEEFSKAHGVKVSHDYFNSEQEMLTKLRTSPGTYDVVLINSTFTQQAQSEGVIQPIDTAKIKNFGDLTPTFRLSANANHLWFENTATLQALRNEGSIPRDIGWDLSAATIWRPKATQNIVMRLSAAALVPGKGFRDLFENRDRNRNYYSVLANVILSY